jgi:hypothetical protein
MENQPVIVNQQPKKRSATRVVCSVLAVLILLCGLCACALGVFTYTVTKTAINASKEGITKLVCNPKTTGDWQRLYERQTTERYRRQNTAQAFESDMRLIADDACTEVKKASLIAIIGNGWSVNVSQKGSFEVLNFKGKIGTRTVDVTLERPTGSSQDYLIDELLVD